MSDDIVSFSGTWNALSIPMRGYELIKDFAHLFQSSLSIPMRGYENEVVEDYDLVDNVIYPHEGL